MAIKLPVAGAGSAGSTSLTRTAKLPGPGDVPRQEIVRDPGLTIPDLGGSGRALEEFGGAVGEVGEVFAKSAERARTREDAVERARGISTFNEAKAAELRRIQTEEDLSSEDVTRKYIQGGQEAVALSKGVRG